MEKITNCPNCGAVITEYRCSYCGTRIVDFADITPLSHEIIYVRIQDHILPVRCTNLSLNFEYSGTATIDAEFDVIPNKR